MIGISLSPGVFCDALASPAIKALLASAGGADSLLHLLKDAGVGSIELRNVTPGMEPAFVADMFHRIQDASMQVTVHGSLAGADRLEACFYRPMASVMKEAATPITVTVHALLRQEETVKALTELCDSGYPLRVALENGRKFPDGSYGDTKDLIEATVSRVGRPNLGICWDMGHDWFNALRFQNGDPKVLPSDGFLRQVIHTHIHGLQGGRTHFPPDPRVMPLAAWCRAIQGQSIYNLELEPERFGPELVPLDAFIQGITRLKASV